jgi:hypothetical protein
VSDVVGALTFNQILFSMQKRILFLLASLLVITMQVMAQVTTSSMSGKITLMSSGETAIGATVIAVHEP